MCQRGRVRPWLSTAQPVRTAVTPAIGHHWGVNPASPVARRLRVPTWFHPRLIIGVVFVLGSVVLGAGLISRADSSRPVLTLNRDLAAGTVVAAGDFHATRVRLSSAGGGYVPAADDVAGQMLSRPVHAGELLPRSALGVAPADETTLTIPVRPENSPDVSRGQRIAVWVSTRYCQAVVVVGDLTVQSVRDAGSGALSASPQSLVVRVPRPLALRVITALGLDDPTIRVGVLSGTADPQANVALPALTGCLAPSRPS